METEFKSTGTLFAIHTIPSYNSVIPILFPVVHKLTMCGKSILTHGSNRL